MRKPSAPPCRLSPTRARPGLSLYILLLALLLPLSSWAATRSAPVEAKRGQLKELHGRIENLNRDLAKSQQTKAHAAGQLKEIESAIAAANHSLLQLGQQRGEIQARLDDLRRQSQRIEGQISAQQGQLGRLLYRQYLRGDQGLDALQLLLAGGDPNQSARDLHYLTLLSRAKANLLGTLHVALAEKQRLAGAAQVQRDALKAVEQKQQAQRSILVARQQQRQVLLVKLVGKIEAQRREIGALQRDEKRLGKLIENLSRRAAKPARPPRRARTKPGQPAPAAPEAPLHNELTPQAQEFSGSFAKLRGHLRLPVRGELVNRYGAARAESGARWKGLFIRAAEGSQVKAVAAGRVVFADWLRGFGNLLIIDHGDAYLSVYGNNQALFRQVGDTVKPGDVIAAVGNSGGNPESGLYFELRQQGQTIDPLKWVDLK
ncbi:MAG: peptidoglycan DD-metalloendopeptidase family protein [Betaproteobacteria bacterium]|nr:peptidoglycan DD-metalloendopeptidase family protein [Betaproteobacteria bacterium]